jgi:aliphatic sulfonates family ABC transporter substrate-binding protein
MSVLTLPSSDGLSLTIRAKALVFEDPASRALLDRIRQIAPSEATTLIIGETGTGKEIVARHVHELSERRDRPFVAVNCGAFSETLVESELFGHERGAFTGALNSKKGWFEAAHGGTLFLDEIGDLRPAIQVKLLRVLQEREVVRLGARTPIPIDVRLVAATNVELSQAVSAGRFREDLYYRLNVAVLSLPPLRDRPGDILPLARYFLGVYGNRLGVASPQLADDAADALLRHPWHGNIRELENVIHHALLVCREGRIRPEDLRLTMTVPREPDRARPAGPAGTVPGAPPLEAALISLFDKGGPELHARIEETVMRAAFAYCDRNQVQTARLLGVSRNIIRARLMAIGEIPAGAARTTPRPDKTVRVGYQRFGLLWLLRASGSLDRSLSERGAAVTWTEFASGMDLVDALRARKVDLGVVGEGPPLLAQAMHAPIVYLAAEPPAPAGEAIVVRRDSSIRTVADLRGARVVLSKGANVHYLLLRALEEIGLSPSMVQISFAPPAEGRTLFESGAADAWVIWDPWLACAEHGGGVRVLRDATGLASNRAYYVAARSFADGEPELVQVFLDEVRALGRTANENAEAVVELLAPAAGIEKAALLVALRRNRFGVRLFDAELAAGQQSVADSSHRHRLIADPVSIVDARWYHAPRAPGV